MLDDDWCRWFWLRFVPGILGCVELGGQRQLKPPFADGELKPTLPAGLTKADQRFFAWMARNA
jgi:hypothetical protein